MVRSMLLKGGVTPGLDEGYMSLVFVSRDNRFL